MKFKSEIELDFTHQFNTAEKTLRAELPAMVEKMAALFKDGAVVKETAYMHAWLSRGIADAEKFVAARKAKAEAKAKTVARAEAKAFFAESAKKTAPKAAPKPSKQISPRSEVDAGLAAAMF
jgi:hypothetical protein